jgi:hypothetical protein
MNHPTAPKRERPSPHFNMPYAGIPETVGEATSSVFIAHPELKTKHWYLASLEPWSHHKIPILGCSLLLSGDGPLVSGRESHGLSDNRWVECRTDALKINFLLCAEKENVKEDSLVEQLGETGAHALDYCLLVPARGTNTEGDRGFVFWLKPDSRQICASDIGKLRQLECKGSL